MRVEEGMIVGSLHSFAHLHRNALVWTMWAVIAETLSMIALGLMERRILIMGGLDVPVGRAIAIAYASNALSASLPIVGSGAATTYSYRRLVSQGATTALATWALILSGVASNIAFALIISVGGVVSGNPAGIAAGALGIVLTFLVVGLAVFAIRRPAVRERLIRAAIWTLERGHRVMRRPQAKASEIVANALAALGAFGVNRQDITYAATSALRNWGLDLICLVFSLRAAGAHVPWWGIILVWAAGSGGAALSLTPGGLGVVEVALTGALVAVGVPGAQALTAVLIYRGITFWLAAAIGWLVYWRLRRDQLIAAPRSAEPQNDPPPDQA